MSMAEIVAVDIGGTHARFAIATLAGGKVVGLALERTLKCADHDGLQAAWACYGSSIGRALPRGAAVAVACQVTGEMLKLTNNGWTIDRSRLPQQLGVDWTLIVNDFAAVAHAVAQADAAHLHPVCGPLTALPTAGVISVVGPGTGLGVALLDVAADGYRVLASEGGHSGFAPADATDAMLAVRLRERFGRVSAERVVSGPGLGNIHAVLSADGGGGHGDADLWARAIAGDDPRVSSTLARFCRCFGSFCGDMALAHGADAVVIAGSLANRLIDHPAMAQFAEGFADKGRFAPAMRRIPVKLAIHPHAGLFGAAAAFARDSATPGRNPITAGDFH